MVNEFSYIRTVVLLGYGRALLNFSRVQKAHVAQYIVPDEGLATFDYTALHP